MKNQEKGLKKDEMQDQVQLILMKMKESKIFWKLKNDLVKRIEQESKIQAMNPDKIQTISRQQQIEQELKKLILNCASKSIKIDPIRVDPIEYINQSRYKWSEILLKKYDYIQEKIKVFRINGNNLGENGTDPDTLHIYDIKNFLQFIYSIKTPTNISTNSRKNSLLKHNIMLPSYSQLKEKFKTLLQQDNIDNETDDLYIQKDRNKRAKYLVENESLEQEMEQFCQGGIPTSYRVDIYMKYFGVEGNQGNNKFQQLLDEYDKNNSIFDIILISDGHEASFDDKYFVFQNNFEKILKVFIRDKEVYKNARIHPQNFDKLSNGDQSKVPQCGFFFPKLFTKYIQPFGYTSMKLDVIYTLFKQFYCRYFCYLLSLSSIKDSLLYLVMLFEDLFQSTDQRLLNHLSQIDNFDVLQVGINWIQYCFIGYMSVEEIFLIFDRIIGYKGLDILAVLAVAIFRHKSDSLFKCTSMKEVEEVLNRPVDDSFLNLIQNYFVY